jgi:hypothetical protein
LIIKEFDPMEMSNEDGEAINLRLIVTALSIGVGAVIASNLSAYLIGLYL